MEIDLLLEKYLLHKDNLEHFLSKIIDDVIDFNDPFNDFNTDGLQERLRLISIVNSDVRFLNKTIKYINDLKQLLLKKGV